MVVYYIIIAAIVLQLVRFLHIFERCPRPKLYHCDSKFISKILRRCPCLTEVYMPPAIWGKCGHIQTAFYAKIGRWNSPSPRGERFHESLRSGETITYDIFEAQKEHETKDDFTILVCPGIANSSEKAYIRTFIKYATYCGYRVAVLNHVGSLANIKLTSPKIFTYGDTKYFASMVSAVENLYPKSTFLILGYSMGGNIVMKYLGEDIRRQRNILCAVSLCQGYDAIRSTEPMKFGVSRFYNRMITMNFKKVLKPHWGVLFGDGDNTTSKSAKFDVTKIQSAKCLHDIEDGLLRHLDGHKSVYAYMDHASCCHSIDNVNLPVLLFNTEDDPVVTNDVHDVPRSYSECHPEAIFATLAYGGHLGCYTGSWYKPDSLTLIEKLIVEYFDSVIEICHVRSSCE